MWFEHFIIDGLNAVSGPRRKEPPAGIPLGAATEHPHRVVVWPHASRCEHAVVIGKTGTGKSYFLEQMALHLAVRSEGFCFFDFHGDSSLSLIARLQRLPNAGTRLVVLDPSHDTRSPGINVLDAGASETERFRRVSEISSILRQRWGVDSFGARTEELLRNTLYTLASTSHTLADMPKFLTDPAFRSACVAQVDHPDIAAYWRDRYEPLSDPQKGAFREPLLNRVTAFLTEPAARHLLSQQRSTIDVSAVMAAGQWLIIRLPKGRLREHAHTLGNLLFAQLQFAALAREALPRHLRPTFSLICDEVQNLGENDLSTLFTEGRKFATPVISANQHLDQLSRQLRGAILSAASHICFRVSHQDAQLLGAELSPQHRARLTLELTQLPRGQAIGRFGASFVAKFQVPAIPPIRPVSATELDRLIEPVTHPRTEIEARLRAGVARLTMPVRAPAADAREEGHHGW